MDAQCMCPADLEPAWDLSHHLHLLKTSRARDTDVLVTVLRAPSHTDVRVAREQQQGTVIGCMRAERCLPLHAPAPVRGGATGIQGRAASVALEGEAPESTWKGASHRSVGNCQGA